VPFNGRRFAACRRVAASAGTATIAPAMQTAAHADLRPITG
jgi:hypothetical protein